ncbi:MAG: TlpA disulfide reductase family protein [Actinomycetes bacterium]
MLRLIFAAMFAVASPTFASADSAADVAPFPFDKFTQLAENRVVPIDEKTKTSILAIDGDTASKEVAHVAKLLRDGAEAVSLKELAPVLASDGVQAIASTMRRHDDPVVRFFASLVLASSGDSESANLIHGIIHDESLTLTDKQMIRTWCDGVGIRAADDDAKKILEHLTTASRKEPKLKKGDTAPDFTVTTTAGIAITSAKLRGKVVVLHFWATSCGPCLGQMPSHIAALAKHDNREVEVVFVSLDDDEKEFESTVEKFKMPFNNVRDARGWGGDLTRAFGVNFMPFDVIIDGEGRIASNSINDIPEVLSNLPAR